MTSTVTAFALFTYYIGNKVMFFSHFFLNVWNKETITCVIISAHSCDVPAVIAAEKCCNLLWDFNLQQTALSWLCKVLWDACKLRQKINWVRQDSINESKCDNWVMNEHVYLPSFLSWCLDFKLTFLVVTITETSSYNLRQIALFLKLKFVSCCDFLRAFQVGAAPRCWTKTISLKEQ